MNVDLEYAKNVQQNNKDDDGTDELNEEGPESCEPDCTVGGPDLDFLKRVLCSPDPSDDDAEEEASDGEGNIAEEPIHDVEETGLPEELHFRKPLDCPL